jgi:uncharacterized protein (DUF1697 family)
MMKKTNCIALLRGINVGGKNIIKMENLKQCFIDIGFHDAKTYIQSGNIIFSTNEMDKIKLRKTIEKQILKTFSLAIQAAVFTANELQEIIEQSPKNFGSEPAKFRYDVWFLFPSITANEIVPNIRLREGVDFLQAGKNALYTSRLTAEMNKSYFPKIIGTPMFQHITIRNWNTTTKLWELAKS